MMSMEHRSCYHFATLILVTFFIWVVPGTVYAQEEEEGIFWGEEEEEFDEFDEDEFLLEDEEFFEEDEEFFEEDEEFLEEEEDFLGEEEFLFEEEEGEEEEQTAVEFADEATREGFTIQVSAASPAYVNHTLMTWNSSIDVRASVDLPMLLQIGPLKFRLGAEVATFRFKNYLPIGGEFGGVGFFGMVTFPAGPSNVQLGVGVIGSSPAFVAAQSFGLSVANLVDVRIGVRSTTTLSAPEELKASGGRAAWMDGFVAVGYTL